STSGSAQPLQLRATPTTARPRRRARRSGHCSATRAAGDRPSASGGNSTASAAGNSGETCPGVRTFAGGGGYEVMTEYADVPVEVLAELRALCLGLPETYEEQAWAGSRWRVRKRTFAQVLTVESGRGPVTLVTFRSSGPELDALFAHGHPFFRAGW